MPYPYFSLCWGTSYLSSNLQTLFHALQAHQFMEGGCEVTPVQSQGYQQFHGDRTKLPGKRCTQMGIWLLVGSRWGSGSAQPVGINRLSNLRSRVQYDLKYDFASCRTLHSFSKGFWEWMQGAVLRKWSSKVTMCWMPSSGNHAWCIPSWNLYASVRVVGAENIHTNGVDVPPSRDSSNWLHPTTQALRLDTYRCIIVWGDFFCPHAIPIGSVHQGRMLGIRRDTSRMMNPACVWCILIPGHMKNVRQRQYRRIGTLWRRVPGFRYVSCWNEEYVCLA